MNYVITVRYQLRGKGRTIDQDLDDAIRLTVGSRPGQGFDGVDLRTSWRTLSWTVTGRRLKRSLRELQELFTTRLAPLHVQKMLSGPHRTISSWSVGYEPVG